jgi:hypothetical protein
MLNKQGSIQMKVSKLFSAVVVATAMVATVADAGSIGRSGGGGGARSSSSSSASKSSSFSAPSKPAAAPAPAPATKPGGIGGNTQGSSVGVRKSEVTAPVAQQVRPSPTPSTTPGYSNPAPSYGSAPSPGFSPGYSAPSPGIGAGGVFMSSLGGSLAGNLLGNALFGHGSHGGGGTTVINNGTPSSGGGGSVSNGAVASGPGGGFVDSGPGGSNFSQPKKEYTVWSFIADVFGFVIVVALLLGIAWLFYKGFQLVRNFINKERGVSTQPFNPTQQFWTIQKAFAAADVVQLQTLLGPDIVDELTNGLTASTVTLHNVSHEVRLSNNTEFSIWYTFEDAGQTVNQVWHYEKFGKDWKLNGIETV